MQRVGLHQHPLELHRLQQLAQGLDFAAGIGGLGGLGDRHTQALGVEAHLGDEPRCARSGLVDGAPQRLAVTDEGVDLLGHTGLGSHPVARPDQLILMSSACSLATKAADVNWQPVRRRLDRRAPT